MDAHLHRDAQRHADCYGYAFAHADADANAYIYSHAHANDDRDPHSDGRDHLRHPGHGI
jgi:hypothetical protein